jgi:Predicted solute binding protein
MKKILTLFFFLVLSSRALFAFSGSGSGTSGDPYLVTSASQLSEVASNLTAYYKQTTDIDLSSATWTVLGTFSGTYDGNGFKVSNFTITAIAAQCGFFGNVSSTGMVKNLGLVSVTCNVGSYSTAGILAGFNAGAIQNCYTTGTLSGSGAIYGGLVGNNNGGTISGCYSSASVTSTASSSTAVVGGLVGQTPGTSTITNSYATGSVTNSAGIAGGLLGQAIAGTPTISYCYSIGAVSGATKGGFVGKYSAGTFTSCFFDQTTSGLTSAAGFGAPTGITAASTSTMQTASTFSSAGWSTSIWSLTDGSYPKLAWQLPTVTSISPTSGPTTGGTSVTITGTNFTGASAVKFGSTNASSFTVNSSTQITATSPAGSAGTVDITVTTTGGTSATGSSDQFTYVAAPTISSITPTSGLTTGGTSVTITGTNFTGASAVKFGSTNASSFTVNSSTQITATSPAASAGTVDITVTTTGGTSATSSSDQFTYSVATGINDAKLDGVTIFPNPVDDRLYIKGVDDGEIAVFDMGGCKVISAMLENNKAVDVSGLAKGVYTVRITTPNGIAEKKLVKK